jgi:hypothetical protein
MIEVIVSTMVVIQFSNGQLRARLVFGYMVIYSKVSIYSSSFRVWFFEGEYIDT